MNLLLFICLVAMGSVGTVMAGKGGYVQPACNAYMHCYRHIGKHKEVFGPVRMCMETDSFTWNQGRKRCRDLNLRLCSSQDICRRSIAEDAPVFQPLSGHVMTPVDDEPGEWMQIGDVRNPDSSVPGICQTYMHDLDNPSPPSGSGSVTSKTWKDAVMCCPKCKIRRFFLGHHVTWNEAHAFCANQMVKMHYPHHTVAHPEKDEKDYYRLCSSTQICMNRDVVRWGEDVYREQWAPIIDGVNDWISTQEDDSDRCGRYSDLYPNLPDWGQDDTCSLPQRGFVYCCRDVRRVKTFHYHHDEPESDEPQEDFGYELDVEFEYAKTLGNIRPIKNKYKGDWMNLTSIPSKADFFRQ